MTNSEHLPVLAITEPAGFPRLWEIVRDPEFDSYVRWMVRKQCEALFWAVQPEELHNALREFLFVGASGRRLEAWAQAHPDAPRAWLYKVLKKEAPRLAGELRAINLETDTWLTREQLAEELGWVYMPAANPRRAGRKHEATGTYPGDEDNVFPAAAAPTIARWSEKNRLLFRKAWIERAPVSEMAEAYGASGPATVKQASRLYTRAMLARSMETRPASFDLIREREAFE